MWVALFFMCVCVLDVFCVTDKRETTTYAWVWQQVFFNYFCPQKRTPLAAMDLVFIRLCGFHSQKHLGALLPEMRDGWLIDLREMGMCHFVNHALLQRPSPALVGCMDYDLSLVVAA